MSRAEKVAYYCSELASARQSSDDATNKTSYNNNNLGSSINENNNVVKNYNMQQDTAHDDSSNPINGGDFSASRLVNNRFNSNDSGDHGEQDQHQFGHHLQNQSAQQTSTSSSQPQYLISNSNPQQLTNLSPHQFNNSKHNNVAPNMFPQQMHSAGYHMNSNHHLYQAGVNQHQQVQAQFRPPIFQAHQRSPSMGDDGRPSQIGAPPNQQQQQQQQEIQRRQMLATNQNVQQQHANLSSSQSLNHSDFNRLRRKVDHSNMGPLTSDVGLESLNLDFEAMLMSDGQNVAACNDPMLQKQQQQQQQHQHANTSQRNLVNQQPHMLDNLGDKPNNGSDMSSSAGYGGANDPSALLANKDPLFMVHNRSEDNIYEEIDILNMNKFQQEYPVDAISLHSDTWKKNKHSKKFLGASFTRWFSTRKKSTNSHNSDQEENPYIDSKSIKRPRLISLPDTIPDNLTPEKLKRRLIVGSIVDSENSYTNSLYRLIYEYKKPLEESDPPILSANKIGIIFFCLDQILQFHKLFGLALSHHVQEWDEKETIGSVFTTSFSKPMVLDIYSGFINNFTNAMETARRASKSRAFAQFLHDKSVASPDRLSFFGSMVKPVQRFPQFILLLSDLLKHTPSNHPDRMPLQRALTELESLADRLNERKRDAERHFAVKQLLKDHLNESNAHSQRYLLRQDDTCLLDMDPNSNTILKSKNRKMYLLNDMMICVSTPSNRLKFAVPLSDITVIESITPAISNLLAHSNFRNMNDNPNAPPSPQNYTIERMECERQSLVHDLELMMRIAALVAALRFQYNGLNPTVPEQICVGIREEIRKKEFQMTLIDRSCLQLRLHSKNHKDTLVIQFNNPESKRDWLIDLRLTKLALVPANNPGWENVTDNPPPTHQASLCSIGQRVPLFVKSLAIFKSEQSHLSCALHYYLRQAPFIGENPAGVLWICNVNVGASSLGALATNGAEVSLIHSYELSDSHVTCLESVGSTLWIGLRQGRIIVIDANSPGEWIQFASLDVQSEVTCIKYFSHFVYVGLINGIVAVFDAINFDKPFLIELTKNYPVTCLMAINDEMFACSQNRIWRIKEMTIVDSLVVQNDNIIPVEEEPRPNLLAHCGNGIWVSLIDSPIVKLYHAESLKHLVDINVGNSIRRVLNDFKDELKITVTSMMATRGLLWIGTNVGMIATLTLPRLQGVPLVSGSINVALHRFLGPVNIMLNLSAGSECVPQLPFNNRNYQINNKPVHTKNEDAEAIYGQYADLMNVGDYITSGRKSGTLSESTSADARAAWEFSGVNMSNINVSDDSGSNASSGAIYQDGMPRGMRPIPNKAVVSSSLAGANQMMPPPQAQPMNAPIGAMPNTLPMAPNAAIAQQQQQQQMQANQISSATGHIYDRVPGQSLIYNQGSLNDVPTAAASSATSSVVVGARTVADSTSIDKLQQQQQQQQQQQVKTSSSGDAGSQADPYGSQTSKMYDQPAQLIQQQQQQVINQSRQALNQLDGNFLTNMQQQINQTQLQQQQQQQQHLQQQQQLLHQQQLAACGGGGVGLSAYGTMGNNNKSKTFAGNKTVLVLAGGNGYQRMALGDNNPYDDHAHVIIWEYKA